MSCHFSSLSKCSRRLPNGTGWRTDRAPNQALSSSSVWHRWPAPSHGAVNRTGGRPYSQQRVLLNVLARRSHHTLHTQSCYRRRIRGTCQLHPCLSLERLHARSALLTKCMRPGCVPWPSFRCVSTGLALGVKDEGRWDGSGSTFAECAWSSWGIY
jgi:hypothetical protein